MVFFTVTRSEAIDMAADVICSWYVEHGYPFGSYTTGTGLASMSNEELEDELYALIVLEEQQGGFESGLLTSVKFKVVRDHEVLRACACCASRKGW